MIESRTETLKGEMEMKHSKRNIQKIFFQNILAVTLSVFAVVLLAIILVILSDSVKVFKQSRLDVLNQLEERNKILNNAMQYLADDIYKGCVPLLLQGAEQYEQIQPEIIQIMDDGSAVLNELGMSPSIIILMKNQCSFQSSDITSSDIAQISSSFWYIDNMSNPASDFWSSRYYISNNQNNMELYYAKSILNESGEYEGIILVSVSADYLKEAYQKMINEGYRMYILDENGKAISHSIPSLLGSNLYYMPYFWKHFEPDSSHFTRNNINIILHTNVYSPDTGWTIVEEIDLRNIIGYFTSVLWIATILLCFCTILAIITSYLLSKKISRPIVTMSEQIIEHESSNIDPRPEYKEVLVLSNVYNLTINKMNDLIEQVKKEEKEKRKMELSFLQAQINPHFLHNTLFSIKCLIEMGQDQKAGEMLSNLVKLLKIPINVNKEWISIKNEITYLESYVALMQHRYEQRHISLNIVVEPELNELLIPRLILQPIVENSIFHGFDDQCKNAVIRITFNLLGEKLIIRIRDNGKGMTSEELSNLWKQSKESCKTFNRIGLLNIRQRIKLLYGEQYDLTIVSEPHQGTEAILTLASRKEELSFVENSSSR